MYIQFQTISCWALAHFVNGPVLLLKNSKKKYQIDKATIMANSDQTTASIDEWIEKINRSREAKLARVSAFEMELISQKDKLQTVEFLMQEWPNKVETFVKSNEKVLPSADLVCSLVEYINILSGECVYLMIFLVELKSYKIFYDIIRV